MQNCHKDGIRKTISEYREAILAAMLTQHHIRTRFVYEIHDRMRVQSKVNLVASESPEANLMSNENATGYAKRQLKWIDATLPASE